MSPEEGDWKEGLPEDIRGDSAFEGIGDIESLAKGFIAFSAGQKEWKEGLPDDIKDDPSLVSIGDVPSLAKSYVHAQKMIGKDKVVIPGDDATDEDRNAFFAKLGRPESGDKYEFTSPENVPDGFPQLDENLIKSFREAAHKFGLSQVQTQDLYSWFLNGQIGQFNDNVRLGNETVDVAEKALRTEWGKAYDQNVNLIERVINVFGIDEVKELLKSSGLNNNVHMIRFLGKIAEGFGEDSLLGEGISTFDVMSPKAAQDQIAELKVDKDFMEAYLHKENAGHKEALEKMTRLYEVGYPEPEK